MSKQIRSVNYAVTDADGFVTAQVIYFDGSTATITEKQKLIEIQNQLISQQRQILMEQK